MRCRVNLKSNPISLTIIAHDGYDSMKLEAAGHDGLVDVGLGCIPNPESALKKKHKGDKVLRRRV